MRMGASLRERVAAGKSAHACDAEIAAACTSIDLPESSIEAWLMRLDLDDVKVEQCANLLADEERRRANRLHFECDRRRFIVSRGVLRILLSTKVGTPPANIEFNYAPNGKPSMAGSAADVQFNVSHSGERALYAISRRCPVGADIEHLEREVDFDAIAGRFFTSPERLILKSTPALERKRAFLAAWTRKEAVVKACGDGLSLPLDGFEVTIAPDATPRVLGVTATPCRESDWRLYTVNAGSDYVATVASFHGT